jgi:hypothetical protein
MARIVIGDRLTPEMENEADNFFDEFDALCRKHGVWLLTRTSWDGEKTTAQTFWRWSKTDTRPAFEIPHSYEVR